MKLLDYIKDKIIFLTVNAILFLIVLIGLFLAKVSLQLIFLIMVIWFGPLVSFILIDFTKQKHYFNELIYISKNLDKKYLLSEVINDPVYTHEMIIYDLLKDTNRSMREHINYFKNIQDEYKEYIETWVHEIKTPIASTMLFIENNNDVIPPHIKSEIQKIEDYVEQVLYYSRSNDVSKDYIIKNFNLEQTIRKVIRKNARDFISKKISINIENINNTVYSDPKWIEFIINQIIINAIKYSKNKDGIINIDSILNKNNVVLTISDNGVGICDKDVNRVFEKGFTGENGRKYSKSTGMGLYLCKKLCIKLGLNISLDSTLGKGTTIHLIFPISDKYFK